MGGENSKLNYRNVVVQLTTKTQPVDASDNEFWDQFWTDVSIGIQDIFMLIPAAEIRALREESPNNLATLCYKAVERLSQIAEASFPTAKDQQTALNCVRLLTRVLPYIFEDPEWRSFFWSALPSEPESAVDGECVPLAQSLLSALCDLLFCPDFTVHSVSKSGPEGPEDMHTIDSCEYIWQAGVGFAQTPVSSTAHDSNRTEILKLILTCFSETMYLEREEAHRTQNRWVSFFTSTSNRHALPLFASLLNVICAYDPVGFGIPYNHLVFSDLREPLVEVALQVLCIVLETDTNVGSPLSHSHSYVTRRPAHDRGFSESEDLTSVPGSVTPSRNSVTGSTVAPCEPNLFVNYMSRIHRDEDFAFILSGLSRLLNSPLVQTYLPGSTKKIQMHQELLVLFWRMCEINKKFMYYVLKSSKVLDLLVPILYHLNDARADPARLGLVHVGVFILLLLSGERNFGVRLNKPYKHRVAIDVTVFTGTHADLLIIVFHKLITTGHRRLQPLFDCLLTIIANVSPYLKSLSMVTANKLLHLLEAFSQPWFLYTGQLHYQLVFLLLEVFNNIIQYQFDGNSNLVYTLIRKRQVFYHLANLPTDKESIQRIVSKHLANGEPSDSEEDSKSSRSTKRKSRQLDSPVKSTVPNKSSEAGGSGEDERPSESHKSDPIPDGELFKPEKSGTSEPSGQGNSLQATLAETPAMQSMTDPHLANATDPSSIEKSSIEDDSNQPLENALVSHSSPGTRTYSHSEAPGIAAKEAGLISDKLHTVHLNHPGIAESSISNGESMDKHQSKEKIRTQTNSRTSPKQQFDSQSSKSATASATSRTATAKSNKSMTVNSNWIPTPEWAIGWKAKMPFQTIMRLLQVLVPQVEKICIDKGLTDETEIVKFLQNGTLVGLLPVPHPILIRKYQSNTGTAIWFRNYLWGVIYLRNVNPPIWYDTNVRLFEIQRF